MQKFLIFICVSSFLAMAVQAQFENNIYFKTWAADGTIFNSSFANNDTLLAECSVTGNITLIIHGWKESVNSLWVSDLVASFLKARQGCVMFMDYNFYSKNLDFYILTTQFGSIQPVVTKKLNQLSQLGYNPDNFFLFGFSYGAHLVFEGAYKFGPRKVGRIDACDPAGPYYTDLTKIHAMDAGKSVQCVHTSTDYGTPSRYCQKDILLGNCGITQVAATAPPKLSHGLCPFIYTSAFTNNFKLVTKDAMYKATYYLCTSKKTEPDVTKFAKPAFMGFNMNMSIPDGQYYALTSKLAPYNVL